MGGTKLRISTHASVDIKCGKPSISVVNIQPPLNIFMCTVRLKLEVRYTERSFNKLHSWVQIKMSCVGKLEGLKNKNQQDNCALSVCADSGLVTGHMAQRFTLQIALEAFLTSWN